MLRVGGGGGPQCRQATMNCRRRRTTVGTMCPATRHDRVDLLVTLGPRTVESTSSHDVDGRLLSAEAAVWPLTTHAEQLQPTLQRFSTVCSNFNTTTAIQSRRYCQCAFRPRRSNAIQQLATTANLGKHSPHHHPTFRQPSFPCADPPPPHLIQISSLSIFILKNQLYLFSCVDISRLAKIKHSSTI